MGSFPDGRVDVETLAAPPDNVVVPRTEAPLVKVTVPVTLEGSEAVNVTD
jgi:hypothetical protein